MTNKLTMKLLKQTILFLILLTNCMALSCSNDTNSIQVKKWKILYEQDYSLVTISHKGGWEPVEIPSTFKLPYPPAREFQYAWLKGEFDINCDPSNYYGISIGRISFTERLFINNHFIGCRSPMEISHMYMPRNYVIPHGILKKGKNEIFICLGIYGYEYGGISSNVLIHPKMEFNHTNLWSNFIYKQVPLGMIFLFTGFMIALILIFLFNRNEKLLLYGSLILLVYIILILSLFSPYRPVSFDFIMSIQFASVPLIGLILMLFIQSLYGVSLPEHNRIFIPVLLNIAIIILFSRDVIYDFTVNRIIGICGIIIGILYILYMFYRLNSIKPNRLNIYMVPLLLATGGFVFIGEIISALTGMHYSGLFYIYSSPFILLILAMFIAGEFTIMRIKMDHLYEKIKLTEEHEKHAHDGDNLSVTEEAEKKLTRVTDFIKEHYTSDISREGLAAAVGMNYNYMSRLFKVYTGKKLSEYMNQLRVEDAAGKLKDKNAKIIDIALSVGFESLVTFNRVFKKTMGETPTEYRNHR